MRARSSPSIADALRLPLWTAAAALVGGIAWSGHLLALPLAFAFPALWASARSRLTAAAVSAAYFLAASHGLPQGVANFYGAGLAWGLALWIAASVAFVCVHGFLWSTRSGWRRAGGFGLAAVLMSVPPFGIVGWAHPITGAGILFPGWGWAGLALAAFGLLAMTSRWRPVAALALTGCWIWSAATCASPPVPQGWVAIDLAAGARLGRDPDLDTQRRLMADVMNAAASGPRVVLLPESALGLWTPTLERFWVEAVRPRGITVIAGAAVVRPDGYDNVLVEIGPHGARVLYRERMPVPVSMWQPWRSWMGEGGGAHAGFFANPVVEVQGQPVAALICYEQLIVWPVVQSALHGPTAIIAAGNGWWTAGTNIIAIQRSSSQAWARLFGLPLVMAFNT